MNDAKICIICGLDCAYRPRTKDTQGRYVCKDCLDDAARAKAAAERAKHQKKLLQEANESNDLAAADNAFVLDLGHHTGLPCPGCGAHNPADFIVCVQCGYDTRERERLGTRIKRRNKGLKD